MSGNGTREHTVCNVQEIRGWGPFVFQLQACEAPTERVMPGRLSSRAGREAVNKRCGAHILRMEEGLELKVVLLLWLWWSERNVVREGEHRRTASDLAFMVHRNAEAFLELHKKPAAVKNNSRKRWAKPPHEWLKYSELRWSFFC